MNKTINKLTLFIIKSNYAYELNLNDIIESKTVLSSYTEYLNTCLIITLNVNKFTSKFYHLLIFRENYISHFK